MGKPTYELLNRSKERWAFIRRSDKPNQRIAIFVHGFRGNYLDTWGHLPDLLKKNAGADSDFQNWDFLFLGYSTKQISTYLDIAMLILSEWRKAARGDSPFDHRHEKVALFGHSLGTLGIRQALCARFKQSSQFWKAVHSITLFGTPLNGSPLALFAPFYKIADALKPANPQLRMLKVWAEGAFDRDPWPAAKVVLGQGDWVVGQRFNELVKWPGDEQPVDETAFLDHSDLSKPDAWTNCAVTSYIRTALR
jgi:pimeloyl-ACP methyl ester carboxylesterase